MNRCGFTLAVTMWMVIRLGKGELTRTRAMIVLRQRSMVGSNLIEKIQGELIVAGPSRSVSITYDWSTTIITRKNCIRLPKKNNQDSRLLVLVLLLLRPIMKE